MLSAQNDIPQAVKTCSWLPFMVDIKALQAGEAIRPQDFTITKETLRQLNKEMPGVANPNPPSSNYPTMEQQYGVIDARMYDAF